MQVAARELAQALASLPLQSAHAAPLTYRHYEGTTQRLARACVLKNDPVTDFSWSFHGD
jgi:hypothetical protein